MCSSAVLLSAALPRSRVKPRALACLGSYSTRMDMSDEEKRRDQLTSAPNATEEDAKPRIVVSEHDGVTRIDIAEDAPVRPSDPRD